MLFTLRPGAVDDELCINEACVVIINPVTERELTAGQDRAVGPIRSGSVQAPGFNRNDSLKRLLHFSISLKWFSARVYRGLTTGSTSLKPTRALRTR